MPSNNYDPSASGKKGNIFGLPHQLYDAEVVIYPVPWDVTASYHSGSSEGPEAILNASTQIDLELYKQDAPWKKGIWMHPISNEILANSQNLRIEASKYIRSLEAHEAENHEAHVLEKINKASVLLKKQILNDTSVYLKQGKKLGLLGGDHSCSLGFVEALGVEYDTFGILQIDAHMDLRRDYQGFEQSHASIMYNVLQRPFITKLVQVGIRDFCEEELELVSQDGRVHVFYDRQLKMDLFNGATWRELCKNIVNELPEMVYISFDIDGLNPYLCPGTGTPVPGGLAFEETVFLVNAIKSAGKKIIGFDLCEVAPRDRDLDWNANVGARILYQLCGLLE